MAAVHFPRLVFKYPFDEAAAYEAEARGYLAYAAVELSDGMRYPVVFYDPVRLRQDLDVEVSEGRAFIAEPGMIVVPEVNVARMQDAVERLSQTGFFQSLRAEPAQGGETSQQPPNAQAPVGATGNGDVVDGSDVAVPRHSLPPT
jgi:hypothetical protein